MILAFFRRNYRPGYPLFPWKMFLNQKVYFRKKVSAHLIFFRKKSLLPPNFFRKKSYSPPNFFEKKSSPPADGPGPGTPKILTRPLIARVHSFSFKEPVKFGRGSVSPNFDPCSQILTRSYLNYMLEMFLMKFTRDKNSYLVSVLSVSVTCTLC